MPEQFDFSAYAQQIQHTAASLFGPGRRVSELSGGMQLLCVAVERDLRRFGESEQSSRIACAPGCGACCVLNVAILFPEAVTIVSYLRKRFDAQEIAGVTERLSALRRDTDCLDDEERIFLRRNCAFLDEQGSCMIHPVRPLLCRAVSSTDASACHDAIVMAPLDGAPSVEMNLFQKSLMETVFQAFGQALSDSGLDGRPRRLSGGVCALLEHPELTQRFLSGEKLPSC